MSFDVRASCNRSSITERVVALRPAMLLDLGTDRLVALCRAFDFGPAQTRFAADLFRKMAGSWGRLPVDGGAPWTSDITDDHTPFEFSLAIDGVAPEVRFLMESQGEVPSLESNWEAARRLNRQLAAGYGVDLRRLSAVEDLFAPTSLCPRFALWHAVCLRPGAASDFKIYLNPQARGPAGALETVEEAMARLGFKDSRVHLPPMGPDDEITYFSLDLSTSPQARVKVYVAHHHATVARIEAAVSSARGYRSGRAAAFCEAMGQGAGPFNARPVLTCLSFVQESAAPVTGTAHFPVRSYASDDESVYERVLHYIHRDGAPSYRRALDAFARRPLADRGGMQTYVSLRLDGERERLTVYLAPEAYAEQAGTPFTYPPVSAAIPTRGSGG